MSPQDTMTMQDGTASTRTDKHPPSPPSSDDASTSSSNDVTPLLLRATMHDNSHGSNTNSPTTLGSVALQQTQETLQLQALARQLEYYFSPYNLQTDTYLQTLRELNDGCVPVTILCNFAKVQAILTSAPTATTIATVPALPFSSGSDSGPVVDATDTTAPSTLATATTAAAASTTAATTTTKPSKPSASVALQQEELRMHAILQAVSEHTERLQVHSIDCNKSQIATDETPSSAITILAVGPSKSWQEQSEQQQQQQERPSNNVIILRDVPETVTAEDLHRLLANVDECPTVVDLRLDVANCWFITLDTIDRDELVRIMMQLRQMTYPGTDEYVMSRLRANATPVDVYNPLPMDHHHDRGMALPFRKKKKKRRTKKKNKNKLSSVPAVGVNNSNINNTNSNRNRRTLRMTPTAEAPTLTEDHFPSLQDDTVEWVTPLDSTDCLDDDVASETRSERSEEPKSFKAHSDAASTATTTSSTTGSFESGSKKLTTVVVGGYAAALLNQSPKSNRTTVPSLSTMMASAVVSSSPKRGRLSRSSSANQDDAAPSSSVVIPRTTATLTPSWGGNRSFVDVLRAADDAATAPTSSPQ